MAKKIINVGVVGLSRGLGFARGAGDLVGMKLVALCDLQEEKLARVGKQFADLGRPITTYTDYSQFLQHDTEAVILANYFHEHAQFAINALKAGKHVMSETTACITVGLGVELIETVEKTGRIYMFAENYPYMAFNQEMRRLFQAGQIGQFVYGEGEYVHPASADFWNSISVGMNHWRNWIPATYYSTHALAPLMFITDTWPVKVNAFIIPQSLDDPVYVRSVRQCDAASMIAVRMDNGATVKLLQYHLRGEGVWVRVHGTRGQMENLRHGNCLMLRVRREQYHERRTDPEEVIVQPHFPVHHEQAMKAGHGGGDFFMNYEFAEAIRRNKPPYLDVYRGVAMSMVGILAYRSALADSNTVAVPDFRRKVERNKYRHDQWNPDPTQRKTGDPWPSIRGNVPPTRQGVLYARKLWKKLGYKGD